MEMEIKKAIFDFAFGEALVDATRRAYAPKNKDHNKEYIRSKSRDSVEKYINSILNFKEVSLEETAKEICDKVGEKAFTFGNAQKLINMTAKYLYSVCYFDISKRNKFEHFDCPLDRQMKEAVVKKYKKAVKSGLIDSDNSILKINWDKVAWSKLTTDECEEINTIEAYRAYQKMVTLLANCEDPDGKEKPEKLFPLEYDFWLWNKFDEAETQN